MDYSYFEEYRNEIKADLVKNVQEKNRKVCELDGMTTIAYENQLKCHGLCAEGNAEIEICDASKFTDLAKNIIKNIYL